MALINFVSHIELALVKPKLLNYQVIHNLLLIFHFILGQINDQSKETHSHR